MTDSPADTVGRILMAVDASMQSYDALEAAAEFASHFQAHLMALFIEDINLFKLAELPFAKELDRSSGVMRPLDPDGVTRALRADAQKFEKRLSEESEKHRISASMRVVRGHYVAAALEMADKGDIVLLHDVARLSYGVSRPKAGKSSFGKSGTFKGPIWVFYDGSEETERGLTLALSLCRKSGSDLKVVLAVTVTDKKIKSRLTERLRALPVLAYQLLPISDSEGLSAALRLSGSSVLILPRAIGQDAKEADPFFSEVKCPRILV